MYGGERVDALQEEGARAARKCHGKRVFPVWSNKLDCHQLSEQHAQQRNAPAQRWSSFLTMGLSVSEGRKGGEEGESMRIICSAYRLVHLQGGQLVRADAGPLWIREGCCYRAGEGGNIE